MSEGDTIFRTAAVLDAVLRDQQVTAVRTRPHPGLSRPPQLQGLVGATITEVRARGKHLLMRFDRGGTLRTHLGMHGAWHRYGRGERWQRPEHQATIVVETARAVAVCFRPAQVELVAVDAVGVLGDLGPDLLAADFDPDAALARLRGRSGELGEVLLDQRVVAGIGNVYKSEVCFVERVSPWALVGNLDDRTLARLLETARRLMAPNVRGGARVTTGSRRAPLWVYGRRGRRCRRCGTAISARRQGPQARMTYWCPRCQA